MSATSQAAFDYPDAFSRNLGLVSPEEQERLRHTTVAIAGLGGVGGVHALTLARMGIARFRIADFDDFELHNFNRQSGATMSTLGQPKCDTMAAMIKDINPEAVVESFAEGVTPGNVEQFLSGVDVGIDGLDFFAVAARETFYAATDRLRIPVAAAGPIGASAALLVFRPGGMTWHEYFAMDMAKSEVEKYILFAIGTAPRATHVSYMDRNYVRLSEKRGPSLSLAVQLCAGVVAAEAMKLVLGRGPVFAAPYYHQFDAYKCRYVRGQLRWGNRGPLQRMKFRMLRKYYL